MNLNLLLSLILYISPVISLAQQKSTPGHFDYFSDTQRSIIDEHIRKTRNRTIWADPNEPKKASVHRSKEDNPSLFGEYTQEYQKTPAATQRPDDAEIGKGTNYAYRFSFLHGYSSIKKACSTVHENKKVNDACATLSNFIYCIQHPYRANRPIECQEFCKDFLPSNKRLKRTLFILQKELHLDPKELIDFTQNLMEQIETRKSPELCSSYGLEHLKSIVNWFSKKIRPAPKVRDYYNENAC
jgi:hypothetical protein